MDQLRAWLYAHDWLLGTLQLTVPLLAARRSAVPAGPAARSLTLALGCNRLRSRGSIVRAAALVIAVVLLAGLAVDPHSSIRFDSYDFGTYVWWKPAVALGDAAL